MHCVIRRYPDAIEAASCDATDAGPMPDRLGDLMLCIGTGVPPTAQPKDLPCCNETFNVCAFETLVSKVLNGVDTKIVHAPMQADTAREMGLFEKLWITSSPVDNTKSGNRAVSVVYAVSDDQCNEWKGLC